MKRLQYRAELDGLRTLAVLAVMIYHANLSIKGIPLFQGGFFGVDIFFVLSGFLITSIIRPQLDNFSFLDFYWRRAKRIIPALLVVLFFTLIAAYQIYDVVSFDALTKSLRSALFFESNEYYMRQNGYFANNLHETLLHTWSLSVEWQFYLIFPFIIYFLNKLTPKHTFSVLLALALISFSISYTALTLLNKPDFAFYSLSTRAWEMLMGGLITYVDRDKLLEKYKETHLSQSMMMLSVFLMLFMILFIDHKIAHPSFFALIIVIATCAYIVFSQKDELITNLFSLKPIVFLGTLSYSMYLWHIPLYVFFRKLKYDQIRNEQFLGLLLLTILCSYLSYKFIESPFRTKLKTKSAIAVLLIAVIGIYTLSKTLKVKEFIPRNDITFGGSSFKNSQGELCHDLIFLGRYCNLNPNGKNTIVTMGDSYMGMYLHALEGFYNKNKNINFIDISAGGTYPFYNFWNKTAISYANYSKKVSNIKIALDNIDLSNSTVIYSQYMVGQLKIDIESIGIKEKQNIISNDLNILQEKVKKLILIYPHPSYNNVVKDTVLKEINQSFFNTNKFRIYKNTAVKISIEDYKLNTKNAFEVFDSVEGGNVIRIYPAQVLCDEKYCYGKKKGEGIYTYDGFHLSITGAEKVFKLIEGYLSE